MHAEKACLVVYHSMSCWRRHPKAENLHQLFCDAIIEMLEQEDRIFIDSCGEFARLKIPNFETKFLPVILKKIETLAIGNPKLVADMLTLYADVTSNFKDSTRRVSKEFYQFCVKLFENINPADNEEALNPIHNNEELNRAVLSVWDAFTSELRDLVAPDALRIMDKTITLVEVLFNESYVDEETCIIYFALLSDLTTYCIDQVSCRKHELNKLMWSCLDVEEIMENPNAVSGIGITSSNICKMDRVLARPLMCKLFDISIKKVKEVLLDEELRVGYYNIIGHTYWFFGDSPEFAPAAPKIVKKTVDLLKEHEAILEDQKNMTFDTEEDELLSTPEEPDIAAPIFALATMSLPYTALLIPHLPLFFNRLCDHLRLADRFDKIEMFCGQTCLIGLVNRLISWNVFKKENVLQQSNAIIEALLSHANPDLYQQVGYLMLNMRQVMGIESWKDFTLRLKNEEIEKHMKKCFSKVAFFNFAAKSKVLFDITIITRNK